MKGDPGMEQFEIKEPIRIEIYKEEYKGLIILAEKYKLLVEGLLNNAEISTYNNELRINNAINVLSIFAQDEVIETYERLINHKVEKQNETI